MIQYIIVGLALGSIYAIASASLVVTFDSAGILNFAFGSMAYVVARFYYLLNTQDNWPSYTAAVLCLLVAAPLMGMFLYTVLFRFLRGRSTLIKLVATIGLSVALPPIADLIFGTQTIDAAPGLALTGDQPFYIFGTPITTNQVIVFGFLAFVLIAGTLILRLTNVGLRVRAVVDSEAMSSLSGTNPGRVALGVWAVSATLAGLAGILVAPTNGLSTMGMTALMAAAFAAVVAARLRSLPIAIAVSLAMGVITDLVQEYLPPNSSFTAAVIPSIPFAIILLSLFYYLVRSGSVREASVDGGPLDRAVRPAHQDQEGTVGKPVSSRGYGALGLVPLAAVALLPLIFHSNAYWLGLVALGMCYGITFLSFNLVTGEGGMLWLCQIIFAGAGAICAAQFANDWHIPILVAIVLAGILVGVVGAIIGMLTIRLGDLFVGLVTLTFGLLVETLVFTRNIFTQGGLGVQVNRPDFALSDFAFSYLAFGVFVLLALLILNLQRSTSGLALRAVRDSESASRTLGLSVLQMKVIVGALGAFVAAIGGGFLALDQLIAQPQSYETFAGLIWLAVVVTMGVRSIAAAALGGMSLALFPGIVQNYLPTRWAELPAILFGIGAITVARHPEGAVGQTARQLRGLAARLRNDDIKSSPSIAPALSANEANNTFPDAGVASDGIEAGLH